MSQKIAPEVKIIRALRELQPEARAAVLRIDIAEFSPTTPRKALPQKRKPRTPAPTLKAPEEAPEAQG